MKIDWTQGMTSDNRPFGYIVGEGGGWFFTRHDTIAETMDSLEVDTDGDGGLSRSDVEDFLWAYLTAGRDVSGFQASEVIA